MGTELLRFLSNTVAYFKFQSRKLHFCSFSMFGRWDSDWISGFLGENFPREENAFEGLSSSLQIVHYVTMQIPSLAVFSGRELHATASTFRYSDRQCREGGALLPHETWTLELQLTL